MNDGSPVRTWMTPLIAPSSVAKGERAEDRHDWRQAEDVAEIIHRPAGQADDRADRKVEVAGDHEHGDADRDDSVLRGQARDIDAIVMGEEKIRPQDRKDGERDGQSAERSEFGTLQQTADRVENPIWSRRGEPADFKGPPSLRSSNVRDGQSANRDQPFADLIVRPRRPS